MKYFSFFVFLLTCNYDLYAQKEAYDHNYEINIAEEKFNISLDDGCISNYKDVINNMLEINNNKNFNNSTLGVGLGIGFSFISPHGMLFSIGVLTYSQIRYLFKFFNIKQYVKLAKIIELSVTEDLNNYDEISNILDKRIKKLNRKYLAKCELSINRQKFLEKLNFYNNSGVLCPDIEGIKIVLDPSTVYLMLLNSMYKDYDCPNLKNKVSKNDFIKEKNVLEKEILIDL